MYCMRNWRWDRHRSWFCFHRLFNLRHEKLLNGLPFHHLLFNAHTYHMVHCKALIDQFLYMIGSRWKEWIWPRSTIFWLLYFVKLKCRHNDQSNTRKWSEFEANQNLTIIRNRTRISIGIVLIGIQNGIIAKH